jgi:hypothetical protein
VNARRIEADVPTRSLVLLVIEDITGRRGERKE